VHKTGTWRTETKPESEWGRAQCPSIVSEDLWNQVNQIIEEQLKTWKKPGKPPVHLFSGLAHCSCGAKMYVAAGSPKYFYRKCCNKIAIVDLEAIIRDEMKMFFGQSERIATHLEAADHNLTEKSALLKTHQQEIQKVREQMNQTHQLYLNKQISGDGFRDLYTPAEKRLKQLNAELPKLEAEVDFLKVNKLSATDVLHEAASLHDRWPAMEVSEKRKIVEAIIEKVVIGNGEIDITYSHIPTSIEQCKNQQKLGFR
jgi:site-specific DNA recombinase